MFENGIKLDIDRLEQDCSISIANALEMLQSCTNPSICHPFIYCLRSPQPDLFTIGTEET